MLQIRVHITDYDRTYRTVNGLQYKNRHSSANERSLYVPIRECNVRNAFPSVIPPLANQRSQGRAYCPLHLTRVLSIHIRSRDTISVAYSQSREPSAPYPKFLPLFGIFLFYAYVCAVKPHTQQLLQETKVGAAKPESKTTTNSHNQQGKTSLPSSQ